MFSETTLANLTKRLVDDSVQTLSTFGKKHVQYLPIRWQTETTIL